jgi:hypothetical protein
MIHSPDLSLEQNPIARALLDSGHDCLLVIPYAAMCESLLVLSTAFLWGALLSHRPTMIGEVSHAQTPMQFVRIVTGQARLSKWRWLFPLTHSHLPDMRFLACLLAVTLVAGSAYRWCLGLEWWILRTFAIDFPHAWLHCVTAIAVVAGIASYGISTWRATRPGIQTHGRNLRETAPVQDWQPAVQVSLTA